VKDSQPLLGRAYELDCVGQEESANRAICAGCTNLTE